MKSMTFTELKKQKAEDLKNGECLKVTSDGGTVFYAVINPEGDMRTRIEGNCDLIDKSRGFPKILKVVPKELKSDSDESKQAGDEGKAEEESKSDKTKDNK